MARAAWVLAMALDSSWSDRCSDDGITANERELDPPTAAVSAAQQPGGAANGARDATELMPAPLLSNQPRSSMRRPRRNAAPRGEQRQSLRGLWERQSRLCLTRP